uniref:Iron hydrogenase small subunit domain-containing protein n=1 Tax=Kalanchoe fedtschenkoi TaxID=63787 RepID=A0A7N0ZWM7_KALFE
MSDKFSPALRISDLNDFIAPSQDCIVSLKGQKPAAAKSDRAEVVISKKQLPVATEPVKISLKDCLACSGCITSAETIMLEKQSLDEFLSHLETTKAVVISLSPQSRAALAVQYGLSTLQVFKKLTTFFKMLGVKAVYDTSCSRDVSLIESCNEFVARYRQSKPGKKQGRNLPMLASACPGWICYAEKTLGSYILPYISSVKSPQQVMGSTVKHHLSEKLGLRPEEIYHVSVMPCYDKKLEASRDDFVFPVESKGGEPNDSVLKIAEVDSVLTTGEVLDLIQAKCADFNNLEESPLDRLFTNVNDDEQLFGANGSSGGYADTIFRYAAKEIFGREVVGPLEFKTIKNSDFREVTLEVDGETVLKFALCYGFRNLQNVVRKIKIGQSDYHYLEVMACPSGCLNGGGQIKPKRGQSGKELLQSLEAVYTDNVLVADPFHNPIIRGLYDEWLEQPGSEKAIKYTHTQYHPIQKSATAQMHNW